MPKKKTPKVSRTTRRARSPRSDPSIVFEHPAGAILKVILEKTPIYQDAAQPSLQAIGKELAPAGKLLGKTTARTIKATLAPLRGLLWGWEKIEKIVMPELAARVENQLHLLVAPKLTVAGPVLESLRFTGNEPELREMYINLLATSMNRETAEKAHPAFAEIIRQLSPDEARIIQYFAKEKTVVQMALATQCPHIPGRQAQLVRYEFLKQAVSLIDIDVTCEHRDLIPAYLDNLRRVSVISVSELGDGYSHDNDTRYKRLENHPLIQDQVKELQAAGTSYRRCGGSFGLTSFGDQFCAACVSPLAQ